VSYKFFEKIFFSNSDLFLFLVLYTNVETVRSYMDTFIGDCVIMK